MTQKTEIETAATIKAQANVLKSALAQSGHEIPLSAAQEALAQIQGYKDWNTFVAIAPPGEKKQYLQLKPMVFEGEDYEANQRELADTKAFSLNHRSKNISWSCEQPTLDDLIEKTGKALATLVAMRDAGVEVQNEDGPEDDYWLLTTDDPAVAARFGFAPDEFEDQDDFD